MNDNCTLLRTCPSVGRHLYREVLASQSSKTETTFHYWWRVKSSFEWNLPPQATTDWLPVEVALLLIGLTKISYTKSGFNHLSLNESPVRLRDQSPEAIATLPPFGPIEG
jgi:hypothetical protein